MLAAVPVECLDMDDDGALGRSLFAGTTEGFEEPGCFIVSLDDAGATEDFEAALRWVVHEEERHAAVVLEVSAADVLLVSAQVSEGDGLGIKDVEKAFGSAAKLDVGPAGFRDRGHVKAIALAEEGLLFGAKMVTGVVGVLDALAEVLAAVELLVLLDEGGEGEFCEAAAHGVSRDAQVWFG